MSLLRRSLTYNVWLIIVKSDTKMNWADCIIIQYKAISAKYMKYIWLQAQKRVAIVTPKIISTATAITLEYII